MRETLGAGKRWLAHLTAMSFTGLSWPRKVFSSSPLRADQSLTRLWWQGRHTGRQSVSGTLAMLMTSTSPYPSSAPVAKHRPLLSQHVQYSAL